MFDLLGRNGESDYLFRFLDLTLEYSLKFGNNLGNFLTHWEERKGRISINAPGGREAITITTVHKAKGLAYGVVIVPFADWSLEPHRGTLLWGHLESTQKPLEAMPDVAVVSLSKGIQQTALAAQYDEEREKTFLEGLNTLYVAFTRPRHRLYVISKRPEEKKTTKTTEELAPAAPTSAARNVADLLHGYLLGRGEWQEDQVSYVLSAGTPAVQRGARELAPSFSLTNLAAAPWEERLKLRRHSTTLFDFDEQQAQGEWNRKLHYALRRLLTAADVGRVASQARGRRNIERPRAARTGRKPGKAGDRPAPGPLFPAAPERGNRARNPGGWRAPARLQARPRGAGALPAGDRPHRRPGDAAGFPPAPAAGEAQAAHPQLCHAV
ncbi:3'-5' exonuclease [Hymenobacter humi]|uniref:3'-5' exonuclease n=1 Tax=Hymenobacter humi TaxID=1411620 RepID=A0ABW2UAG3_9BACT